MSIRENFEIPKKYNTISLVLMAVGIIATLVLYLEAGAKNDIHEQARFWGALLHNSVYFLLVVNASMFFICATTLAWGGWQMSFRRVPEAISTAVPIIGIISGIILLAICLGNGKDLYHWANDKIVAGDDVLQYKSGFLNKKFFVIWTIISITGWSLLGAKLRQLSRKLDDEPLQNIDEAKKYIWNNTVWAAVYAVLFALTVLSSIPWLWLMSIDAHWYSTMYSWYTFASTFVAGMALIALYVIYLKSKGYLEYANEEHLHDIGKFMFAFSIFWTYLWFSQYMLIWYSNQPEETTYFIKRVGNSIYKSPYSGVFWFMFLINFIAPLLILMKRDSKRNYTTLALMALLILFGHWLDFYQMVFPGISPNHTPNGFYYDLGIAAGFVGLIMFVVGRGLAKAPLLAKNHPFVKESIIHHT